MTRRAIALPPPRQPGVSYQVRLYRSGKRVRVGRIADRVVETAPMPRIRMTKSRRRLWRARRRIGL